MRLPNTFDIFDTLLARRCIEPKNIFLEIEKNAELPGFSEARMQAEAAVSNQQYTLHDIYSHLEKKLGWEKERCLFLMEMEIDIEVSNAISIKENLEAVKNGDILITDMYLPRSVILRMLDKVGLRKQIGLVISSGGKSSGYIWNVLKEVIPIEQHWGDNLHSDVNSPLAFDVFAEHLTNSNISNHESFFRNNGLELLARVVREARLTQLSIRNGNEVNKQKLLQINNNIPILFLCAIYLKNIAANNKIKNILFSARDCFYLFKIFQFLNKKCDWKIPSEYFFTSRVCRVDPSNSYLHYFKKFATERSLVVDLCGSGWSLSHLYNQAGVTPQTFFLHDLRANAGVKNAYDQVRKSPSDIFIHSLVTDASLKNAYLEQLNYVDSGMSVDVLVLNNCESVIPKFEYPDYPDKVQTIIENIENTQLEFLNILNNVNVDALVNEVELAMDKIAPIVTILYQDIAVNMAPMTDLIAYHNAQDRKSFWKIKNKLKKVTV